MANCVLHITCFCKEYSSVLVDFMYSESSLPRYRKARCMKSEVHTQVDIKFGCVSFWTITALVIRKFFNLNWTFWVFSAVYLSHTAAFLSLASVLVVQSFLLPWRRLVFLPWSDGNWYLQSFNNLPICLHCLPNERRFNRLLLGVLA